MTRQTQEHRQFETPIWHNCRDCDGFSGTSFVAILQTRNEWNFDAWWPLEAAFAHTADSYRNRPMPKALICAIVRIFTEVDERLHHQYIESAIPPIANLDDEEWYDWGERFRLAAMGALRGYRMEHLLARPPNPLLQDLKECDRAPQPEPFYDPRYMGLWKNETGSPHYDENGFIFRLHERDFWNKAKFAILEKALNRIAEDFRGDDMPKHMIGSIMHLYEYIFGRLHWHRASNDGSSINRFTNTDCERWTEHVRKVFTDAMCGAPGGASQEPSGN